MIEVVRAPAFAAVQDLGRDGARSAGVPRGGALDGFSLRCGNALLGNSLDAAGIEWGLTGGTVRFRSGAYVALTGAEVQARLNGARLQSGEVTAVPAGGDLTLERFVRGRFAYLCVAGGIDVPRVLGGRGTYLPAGFGGFQGRLLRTGDVLPVAASSGRVRGGVRLPPEATLAGSRVSPDAAQSIAVLRGPQADALAADDWEKLLGGALTVDVRSDRTGYRLTGTPLESGPRSDALSEPACVGAVQLTPDGTLIVLMADGPTVGGYPKIAVVTSADLPRLVQAGVGDPVSLRLVEKAEALAELRAREALVQGISATAEGGSSE